MTTVPEWVARHRLIAAAQIDNPEPTSRRRWQAFDDAFSPEVILRMLDVIERSAGVVDDIDQRRVNPEAFERYTALNIGFAMLVATNRSIEPDCPHLSATGIDQADGDDKVWRCDQCGRLYRVIVIEGISHYVPALGV